MVLPVISLPASVLLLQISWQTVATENSVGLESTMSAYSQVTRGMFTPVVNKVASISHMLPSLTAFFSSH